MCDYKFNSSIAATASDSDSESSASASSSGSSKSFQSDFSLSTASGDDNDCIISRKKKSVRFCGEVQVFKIPSRKEQIASVISRCWKNMMNTSKTSTTTNSSYSSSNLITTKKNSIKKLKFFKLVTVIYIPSRSDLKSFSTDLWYGRDEMSMMASDTIPEF
jgi:hypothetical protein